MPKEITFISDEDVLFIKNFATVDEKTLGQSIMIENVCNLEDAPVENSETELNKDAININNDHHHNAIQVKNTEVEPEKTAIQLCMKEFLLALQSNMNKLMIEQNETCKEDIKLLRNLTMYIIYTKI